MVSNHPDDALEIERRASAEHDGERDLLRDGGASISNLVSGGASRAIATNSQLSKSGQGLQMSSFSLFLLNPYNITRGGAQFLTSIVTELFQARRQRVRDIKPRISRGMPFPVLKASTTTIMRDMLTDLVIGEMGRGTPIIYADYLGYDEIAHHAGPERPESMEQLDRVDRMMRSLSRASEDAPRRYHFIMVSDHGQTQGAPFHDRYGITLEELVRSLMEGEVTSLDATNDVEGWGHVNTFLTEASRTPGTTGRIMRRTMRGNTEDGVVALGDTDAQLKGARVEGPAAPRRRTPSPERRCRTSWSRRPATWPTSTSPRSASVSAWRASPPGIPDLLPGLVRHEGIGFIMVRSEEHGALVIGRDGMRNLDSGEIEGNDPLEDFGEHVVANLKRLDSFEHIGDIFVISMYDPSTDEIAPFEHQVGAHGGLGGMQTKAFVLYPAAFERHEKAHLARGRRGGQSQDPGVDRRRPASSMRLASRPKKSRPSPRPSCRRSSRRPQWPSEQGRPGAFTHRSEADQRAWGGPSRATSSAASTRLRTCSLPRMLVM